MSTLGMRPSLRIFSLVLLASLALSAVIGSLAHSRSYEQRQRILACDGAEQCYKKLILDSIANNNLGSGYALLRDIYNETPGFRASCASFALSLTEDVYKRYPTYQSLKLTPDVVACNYGFLQQYPQSLLFASKNPEEAQGFCSYVASSIGKEVPGAEAECYRGIGRGLPFIDADSQKGVAHMAAYALSECKTLTSDSSNYGTCVSGLFNILGRAAAKRQFGLSIDTSDPMRLCKEQKDSYAQSRCFGNYKATVISMVPNNNARVAQKDILDLYGDSAAEFADNAMWTLGYEWARTHLVADADAQTAVAMCSSLTGKYVNDCIGGISVGIVKHGVPGAQHLLLADFCAVARREMPSLAPTDCPSTQAVGYLRGFYAPEDFARAYAYLQNRLGSIVRLDDVERGGYGY